MSTRAEDLSKAAHSHLVESLMMTVNKALVASTGRGVAMVAGGNNKAALLTLCARNIAMGAAVQLANEGMSRGAAMLAIRRLLLEVFDEATQELDGENG